MPDLIPLCRHTDENIKAFNGRIAHACNEFHISHAELHLFDGRLLILLSSGVEPATEEDLSSGLATTLGEPVLTGPPICCAVASLSVEDQENNGKVYSGARNIERRLQKIFEIGADSIVDIQVKQMDFFGWVEDPNNPGNVVYVPVKECFALVTWISEETEDTADEDDEEGDDEDGGGGEGAPDGDDGNDIEEPEDKDPDAPVADAEVIKAPKKGKGRSNKGDE